MKKITRLLTGAFILLFSANNASAQDFMESANNQPYLGIRVSFEAPVPGNYKIKSGATEVSFDMFKTGAGFDAGVVYNIPVWKNLYFEPGLSLYYNAMGVDVSTIDPDGMDVTDVKMSVRRFGFRIPFVMGYRFDFQPCSAYIFTGPELELGLSGKAHASAKYAGHKESDSQSIYGDEGMFRRCNLGWKIGVGLGVDNYYLGLSGNIGMLNMVKGSERDAKITMHENLFQLTLGYNF